MFNSTTDVNEGSFIDPAVSNDSIDENLGLEEPGIPGCPDHARMHSNTFWVSSVWSTYPKCDNTNALSGIC